MCMADRDVVERAGALLGSSVWVAQSRREGWSDVYTIESEGRALFCGWSASAH